MGTSLGAALLLTNKLTRWKSLFRTVYFAPFVTTRNRQESVGIGLPAARAIAERHGGTLALVPAEEGDQGVAQLCRP